MKCPKCSAYMMDTGPHAARCGFCAMDAALEKLSATGDALYDAAYAAREVVKELTDRQEKQKENMK